LAAVKSIRSLERGLLVIRLLAQHGRLTLHDLHISSGLPKATLMRILATLEQQGWVKRFLGDHSYRLSVDAVSLGSKILPDTELLELATSVLDQLCQQVFWPSDIAVYNGTTMQIMETSRRQAPFLINRKVMGMMPHILWSALGRVYLANCSSARRKIIIDRLKNSNLREDRTVQNEKWLQRLLDQTRSQGYGVREPGYWTNNVDVGGDLSAIAVPVIVGEEVVACINLLWPEGLMDVSTFASQYHTQLLGAADELAQKLKKADHFSGTLTSDAV